jgi:hypothetical protein
MAWKNLHSDVEDEFATDATDWEAQCAETRRRKYRPERRAVINERKRWLRALERAKLPPKAPPAPKPVKAPWPRKRAYVLSVCKQCGTQFEFKKGTTGDLCSRKCSWLSKLPKLQACRWAHLPPRPAPRQAKCEQCGTEFTVKPRLSGRFCSLACVARCNSRLGVIARWKRKTCADIAKLKRQ